MRNLSLQDNEAEPTPVAIGSEKKTYAKNDELVFEENGDLQNTERALLNILDDYGEEKYYSENSQRALLNILDDYNAEKGNMESSQRALLNILDDYSEEKYYSENSQRALLNILDDYSTEKENMENTQRAVLNILEDYGEEKLNLEKTLSATLNILDDYSEEKKKVEIINNDLSSANRELEQFAYIAAHDLQEPLRTIANFVGLFEKKYFGKYDKDADQYLQHIVNATSKMQSLIKHLLDFSRIGRGLSFVAVDCNKVLEAVIAEMQASIVESNAKITSSLLPVLKGSEIELKQLFQNLISNAIKFQKKGKSPEIIISVEQKDTEFIFAVKDNGIGIEEQFIPKLFIIFQRLHTAAEYPGTGIGLAICKKIVSLHGGKIWIESKLGEGSTFYFCIPKELK